jgi:hypothetical protein
MTPEEEKLYKAAKRKVKRLRSFYSNLLSYFAIGTFLTFINWWTQKNDDDIHWWGNVGLDWMGNWNFLSWIRLVPQKYFV